MGIKEETSQDPTTQRLMDLYFATVDKPNSVASGDNTLHLEEDTLAAFVEGGLSDRESKPVMDHLVRCGFCLKTSAELIRLQNHFSEEPAKVVPKESVRISDVLSNILQKILGTSDATVFAHEESPEDEKDSPEEDKKEEE